LRVSVHLDLFGRPHEKHIVVAGERGSIQCLFDPDQIRIGDAAEAIWTIESFAIERNDMFMAVAQEFLNLIEDESADPSCTILDGLKTLRIIEACRESQSTGREIKLSSPNDD
jgi:predicted dehydrogenase